MVQWEYKIVKEQKHDESHINILGRDEWELLPIGGDALYFKRPYYPPGHDIIT